MSKIMERCAFLVLLAPSIGNLAAWAQSDGRQCFLTDPVQCNDPKTWNVPSYSAVPLKPIDLPNVSLMTLRSGSCQIDIAQKTGRVTITGCDMDEASRTFWREVERMAGESMRRTQDAK